MTTADRSESSHAPESTSTAHSEKLSSAEQTISHTKNASKAMSAIHDEVNRIRSFDNSTYHDNGKQFHEDVGTLNAFLKRDSALPPFEITQDGKGNPNVIEKNLGSGGNPTSLEQLVESVKGDTPAQAQQAAQVASSLDGYLQHNGFTANAAAGIVGNVAQESVLNPESTGDGGAGLIGWTPAPPGIVTNNPRADLGTQENALMQYVNQNGSVADINQNASSPTAAADYFMNNYERPYAPSEDAGFREQSAAAAAELGPGSAATQGDNTAPGGGGQSPSQEDSSVIDRRRFYMQQPDGSSCGSTSLAMALFDFDSSGGKSGLNFSGSTFANPSSREQTLQSVVSNTENLTSGGNIDTEAQLAQQYGLQAKVHFDPNSGQSITTQNVDQAVGQLNTALKAGHGVIINAPHHYIYISGMTPDGQYVMGDPADPNTGTWDVNRLKSELDHTYDPFNSAISESNPDPSPTGFVEVWNANQPVHKTFVSSANPDGSASASSSGDASAGGTATTGTGSGSTYNGAGSPVTGSPSAVPAGGAESSIGSSAAPASGDSSPVSSAAPAGGDSSPVSSPAPAGGDSSTGSSAASAGGPSDGSSGTTDGDPTGSDSPDAAQMDNLLTQQGFSSGAASALLNDLMQVDGSLTPSQLKKFLHSLEQNDPSLLKKLESTKSSSKIAADLAKAHGAGISLPGKK